MTRLTVLTTATLTASLLALSAAPAHAVDLADDYGRLIREGLSSAEQGSTSQAADAFDGARLVKPEGAEAAMNLGLALAREGRTEEAVRQFSEVARMAGEDRAPLRARALYNRGRVQLDAARAAFDAEPTDLERAMELALASLESSDQAYRTDSELDAARWNREQARHLLAEIAQVPPPEEQPQQQQQQGDQNQDQQDGEQENQEGSDQQGDQNEGEQQGEQNEDQQEGDQGEQQQDQSGGRQQDGEQRQDGQQSDQSGDGEQQQNPEGQPRQDDPGDQQDGEGQQQSGGDQREGEGEAQQGDEQSGEQQPGQQAGGTSVQPVQPGEGMGEREARKLLQLMGNEQMLLIRPGRQTYGTTIPEKSW